MMLMCHVMVEDPVTETADTAPGLPFVSFDHMFAFSAHGTVLDMVRKGVQSNEPLPLAILVFLTHRFQSKEPRDKIYALLGISVDRNELPFEPSYEDPEEIVFLKTASFLMSGGAWFTILVFTGRGYEPMFPPNSRPYVYTLPSWVPNFNAIEMLGIRAIPEGAVETMDPTGRVEFPPGDPRAIQIRVNEFDSVGYLGPILRELKKYSVLQPVKSFGDDPPMEDILRFAYDAGQHTREWYAPCKQLAQNYARCPEDPQKTVEQDFWEFCMQGNPVQDAAQMGEDVGDPVLPIPSSSDARDIFEFFVLSDVDQLLARKESSIKGVPIKKAAKLQIQLMERFGFSVRDRAFSITKAGSMALVPPLSRVGDTLAHVCGGFQPGVLRKGNGTSEWVGVCYVHGVDDVYKGSDWNDAVIV
jgi:hypothetical protein